MIETTLPPPDQRAELCSALSVLENYEKMAPRGEQGANTGETNKIDLNIAPAKALVNLPIVYSNGKYQSRETPRGFKETPFDQAVFFDWSPVKWKDGHRKKENFEQASCLFVDIDGGFPLVEFEKKFSWARHIVVTSRNHQKPKKGKTEDRYHVLFPLAEPITNADRFAHFQALLITAVGVADEAMHGADGFFFGHDAAETFPTEGRPFNPLDPDNYAGTIEKCGGHNRRDWILHAPKAPKLTADDLEEQTRFFAEVAERDGWIPNPGEIDGLVACRAGKWQSPSEYAQSRQAARGASTEVIVAASMAGIVQAAPRAIWTPGHAIETKSGAFRPLPTLENFVRLYEHYGARIRENLMSGEVEIELPNWGKNEGSHANAKIEVLDSLARLNLLSADGGRAYLAAIGNRNRFHPVRDWMNALPPWDGTDHIRKLCARLDVDEDASPKCWRILVRKWLVSAVAALFADRFHSRGVLVLQGGQGNGKTSFWRLLSPDPAWFLEGRNIDPADRDSVAQALSVWIVEIGELESSLRRELARLKAFLTDAQNTYRQPYAPRPETHPRQTVFCASVNDGEFLRDNTGNSRFWVLSVRSIDYESPIDHAGLWAQAKMAYDTGENWWLDAGEERDLEASNREHEEHDSISDLIASPEFFDWDNPDAQRRHLSGTEIFHTLGVYEASGPMPHNRLKAELTKRGAPATKIKGKRGFWVPIKIKNGEAGGF